MNNLPESGWLKLTNEKTYYVSYVIFRADEDSDNVLQRYSDKIWFGLFEESGKRMKDCDIYMDGYGPGVSFETALKFLMEDHLKDYEVELLEESPVFPKEDDDDWDIPF